MVLNGEQIRMDGDRLGMLLTQAWQVREENFSPVLNVVHPVDTVPISVTGGSCALGCRHCAGHYLKGMHSLPAGSGVLPPATSYLISGGCDSKGRVPLAEKASLLKKLKKGKKYNFHVGLPAPEDIALLEELAEVVSFDLVVDDEIIRTVYGLPKGAQDYIKAYRLLTRKVPVIPHITLGLKGEIGQGEESAIEVIVKFGARAVVFLVFTPTRGTPMENYAPPPPEKVAEFLAWARVRLPKTPLYLGCMRPGGGYRRVLDPLVVESGVNTIVQPAPSSLTRAQEMGLKINILRECCAFY